MVGRRNDLAGWLRRRYRHSRVSGNPERPQKMMFPCYCRLVDSRLRGNDGRGWRDGPGWVGWPGMGRPGWGGWPGMGGLGWGGWPGMGGAGMGRRGWHGGSGENGLFYVEDILAELVVLVEFAVDFAGAMDDGGVVAAAQQAAHFRGGKFQFVNQQIHGYLAG